MSPTIFISAGEASGEHYGALLISALQQKLTGQNRAAAFFGMGGDRMVAAGLERIVRSEDMAVMGITEVVRHLPRIYRGFRKLKQAIRARRPDVAVQPIFIRTRGSRTTSAVEDLSYGNCTSIRS